MAFVMILNYYINDDYLDEIYMLLNKVNLDYYYVKMAKAWLISYLIIYYYDRTIDYLKNSNLDTWTFNKVIEKSIESYRVNDMNKEELRKLRRY